MANEDWKLQVSIRTSASKDSDMVNIRANTADELSVLLEGISDFSAQIAATSKMVQGAYAVSPLGTTGLTQGNLPPVISSTVQEVGASPTCVHGNRKFLSGISKKNGKPYKMWVCTQPQGVDQCQAVNG
jgi:hypothetical protein